MESPSAVLAALAVIIAQATARVVLFWAIFSHTSPRWSSLRPQLGTRKTDQTLRYANTVNSLIK
jgi:hypothetical protein